MEKYFYTENRDGRCQNFLLGRLSKLLLGLLLRLWQGPRLLFLLLLCWEQLFWCKDLATKDMPSFHNFKALNLIHCIQSVSPCLKTWIFEQLLSWRIFKSSISNDIYWNLDQKLGKKICNANIVKFGFRISNCQRWEYYIIEYTCAVKYKFFSKNEKISSLKATFPVTAQLYRCVCIRSASQSLSTAYRSSFTFFCEQLGFPI